MIFFTRTDPARNINRFYLVRLSPTLFGDWTLWREWGRSGSPGRVRITSFASHAEAEKEQRRTSRRRQRHGYSERQ